MRRRLITTGGTIDKVYAPTTGEMTFSGTNIPAMLEQARINIDGLSVEEIMKIDSLHMTDVHRERIAKACINALEKQIIITHGTDTMPETARYIAKGLNERLGEKTIILTGAMVPFSVNGSDALFNLGSAFAHAGVLDPGVYVSMNGQAFDADSVVKNKQKGIFESRQA